MQRDNNHRTTTTTLSDMDAKFASRIERGIETVQAWDADSSLLMECRSSIPLKLLQNKTYSRDDDCHYRGNALFLKRLTRYFQSIMTWVNNPPCQSCSSTSTTFTTTRGPETPDEHQGQASRVEVYTCADCGATTTFPRYNSVRTLLHTKRGRCGEYANLFGLLCRSVGFETRYILDVTDHVWVEVYADERWIMADGCEGVIDEPSMYEAGWGKDLCCMIAISKDDGVVDVTSKYTRQYLSNDLQTRRRTTCTTDENVLAKIVQKFSQQIQSTMTKSRLQEIEKRHAREQQEFRRFQQETTWAERYKEGRTSGSLAWRASRHEIGDSTDENNTTTTPPLIQGFHVESFSPPSILPTTTTSNGLLLDITLTSPTKLATTPQHGSIVVSGVQCAVGQPKSISVVVLDTQTLGCILQSRSFDTWESFSEFVNTLPADRIVVCCGTMEHKEEEETKQGTMKHTNNTSTKSSYLSNLQRLGGFELPSFPNNTKKNNTKETSENKVEDGSIMYIGVVDRKPDWAVCINNSTPDADSIHIRIPFPSKNENNNNMSLPQLKLRTERNTMARSVAGRLPETIMPLQTQLLASEQQKRTAVMSFFQKLQTESEPTKNAEDHHKQQKQKQYVGYTTKAKSPIYLLDESSYPFEKLSSSASSPAQGCWNTFHFLPEQLVPTDDNGIEDSEESTAAATTTTTTATNLISIPKYDIPLESSFFITLLGPQLLTKSSSSSNVLLNTDDALCNSRLIGLYFSAHWCGPCRRFTPMLAEVYTHLKEEVAPSHGLEIVFVSSDRDQGSFKQYYGTMPWTAVPFNHGRMLQAQISARYGVNGIPAFVVLDAMSGEIVVSISESRSDVMKACQGGDDGIARMLTQQWFPKIPQMSQEILQLLELSCQEENENGSDENSGNDHNNATEHPYFVRDEKESEEKLSSATAIDATERIKEIFTTLVANGDAPNTAAAKAIKLLAEEQSQQHEDVLEAGSLNSLPWCSTICTAPIKHSTLDDPQANSVEITFSDAGTTNATEKMTGIRILRMKSSSEGDGDGAILGIQACYDNHIFGEKYVLKPSLKEAGEWVTMTDTCGGDSSTSFGIVGKLGATSITDLSIWTSTYSQPLHDASSLDGDKFLLKSPQDGYVVTGIHGVITTAGLSSLGLVCQKKASNADNADTIERAPHDMNQMAYQVAEQNNSPQAVRTVVTTALKYLENVKREPWTSKFRSFKLSNKVVDRITRIEGGLALLNQFGFLVYGTETDFMACIPVGADLDVMYTRMTQILELFTKDQGDV